MITIPSSSVIRPENSSPSGLPVDSDVVVGEIEGFLQQAIARMPLDQAEARRDGPGRPRILPSMCIWAGLLVCVLRGFTSQLALWRLLTAGGFWSYPRFAVSDEALYKRLSKAGTTPLIWLFVHISSLLRERLAPYAEEKLAPFASEVVSLDETALDPLARLLPSLRGMPPGDDRLLPGKLAGLFDVRRQQWVHVEHHPQPHQNEKVGAREILQRLPSGSLILYDLGYFGFELFDDVTDMGHWWICRLRAKTSYEVLHVFYQQGDTFDGIVWLGKYKPDRAAHAVRLVRFRIGPNLHCYVTNVLDPKLLSLHEIARLYARRWDFELAVKTVKRHLKLHLRWSSKTVVMLQQMWAVLIIAQILQAFQLEIAKRAGVDPFDVSLALLIEYAPRFASMGRDPITVFVEQGRELGFIRPSTRTVIQAPDLQPDQLKPLPPELVLERPARHSQRNCGPNRPPKKRNRN